MMTSSRPRFPTVGFLHPIEEVSGRAQKDNKLQSRQAKGAFEGGVFKCGIANGPVCSQKRVFALSFYKIMQ
jgi:hypothetical protein